MTNRLATIHCLAPLYHTYNARHPSNIVSISTTLISTMEAFCRKEYVTMGLYQIAKAVSFLNNECSLVRHPSLTEYYKPEHLWTPPPTPNALKSL